MAITSPQQLLALKLQHIQDAETEAMGLLEEIRGQVQDDQLLQAIRMRMDEGRSVLEGVRNAMPKADGQAGADMQNKAARGIIQEARTLMSEIEDPDMKEAVAIGSIQSLEHYCIATWGTVKALARQMGEQQVVEVMERALASGKQLDGQLTEIAESRVNPEAMHSQGGQGAGAQDGQQPQA